jgi:hypothetical protein
LVALFDSGYKLSGLQRTILFNPPAMSSNKKGFILRLRDRSVLVLHEQCPQYSVSLSCKHGAIGTVTYQFRSDCRYHTAGHPWARTDHFSVFEATAIEEIVFLGSGPNCPWSGEVEIPEWTWKPFCSQLAYVTVAFKQGMYPLASEGSVEVIDYIPPEREKLERGQHEKVEPDSK